MNADDSARPTVSGQTLRDADRRAPWLSRVSHCLFTDLRNATTNRIYTAVGYEPVADFVKHTFESPIR